MLSYVWDTCQSKLYITATWCCLMYETHARVSCTALLLDAVLCMRHMQQKCSTHFKINFLQLFLNKVSNTDSQEPLVILVVLHDSGKLVSHLFHTQKKNKHICNWIDEYDEMKFNFSTNAIQDPPFKALLLYPPQRSCRGVYWFHHVRPSVCPSVRFAVPLSVRPFCRPSVRPSVCRQILCRTITWVVFLRIF